MEPAMVHNRFQCFWPLLAGRGYHTKSLAGTAAYKALTIGGWKHI